jgi:Synaptobrevin
VDNILSSGHEGEWATRTPSQYGVWFVQSDSNNLIYLALVKSGYSDRFASALLKDLKELFFTQGPEHLKNSPSEAYTTIMSSDLRKLVLKYNDTNSLDKVANANQRVLEVKSLASEGIQQVMKNIESADVLAAKSSELEGNSRMFKNDAKRLERLMYCRKMKITCILVLVVLGVLLYIIIPIIVSASH